MVYTCESCKKPFKRTGARPARFCSRPCQAAATKARDVSCQVCGAVFRIWGERPGKYCSRACKGVASRLPENKCAVCEKIFRPRPGGGAQPCCSLQCGFTYRLARNGWHEKRERNCELCGKPFYSMMPNARFCGHTCANKWQGRNKTNHTCKVCGSQFRWSPSRTLSGKYVITYCSMACRSADPVFREKLIQLNAKQQEGKTNKLERAGYAMLDAIGVPYEPQSLLCKKFCVDAFVPSLNIVIQFDGDYWHGHPQRFPEPDARQQKRIWLDKSQDAYLTKCGYRIIRLWESDVYKKRESVISQLRASLVLR